ncbi:MAG: site-specific DNA-methyltransferase [Desulfuromonadales bacterium]
MAKKQKLELTWIGKENRPKLEPRILLEDPDKSYHAPHRVSDKDIFDNRLIFGDNLLALKALEQEFAGKVKCVFIAPPYNTGSAFTHYDDGLEHSIWLSLMRDRLEIIRNLLSDDGSLWITIDDNEAHYLKVLCDEVFGRANFLTTICWEKIYTLKNSAKHFSAMHDFVLVYTKNIDKLTLWPLERGEKQNAGFKNPDNDPRGPWLDSAMHGRNFYSKGSYVVASPSGKEFSPPPGRYWTVSEVNFKALDADNRVWWGKGKGNAPRKKTFITEVRQGVVPGTIWFYKDAGQNAEAKNEIKELFAKDSEVFITPKPEKLIKQILTIATRPGHLVIDSFAGTGTTGAVAQKMGRRWIMVELGEHCHTHIIPRLQKVIDGTDQGGVSKAVGWKGGGGFRYYHLAPSLMEKDKWDNWVISKQYNSAMLAEAVCKLEGFIYAPSETLYWQHGHSTETDFIYVTTQNLNFDQLQQVADEVGKSRSLLVCCSAFRGRADAFPNLTIKKIPNAVLSRCEWGHDDYSLNVENLPQKPPEPGQMGLDL